MWFGVLIGVGIGWVGHRMTQRAEAKAEARRREEARRAEAERRERDRLVLIEMEAQFGE
jgi:hypothetical protein